MGIATPTSYIIDLIPDLEKIESPDLIGLYVLALDATGWDKNQIDTVNTLFLKQPAASTEQSSPTSPTSQRRPNALREQFYSLIQTRPTTPQPIQQQPVQQSRANKLRETVRIVDRLV